MKYQIVTQDTGLVIEQYTHYKDAMTALRSFYKRRPDCIQPVMMTKDSEPYNNGLYYRANKTYR